MCDLKKFIENNNDVGESTRININFGGRINYLEGDWVKAVLLRHLDEITNMGLTNSVRNLASKLIDLNELERVDLKNNIEKKGIYHCIDVFYVKRLNKNRAEKCSIAFIVKKMIRTYHIKICGNVG